MGWIADLLKEIPSAARYKSELEAMEKENASLKSEVAKLRQEIQQRDDLAEKEKFHSDRLEEVKEQILQLLAKHPKITEAQIASAMEINVQLVTFHLTELARTEFVHGSYSAMYDTEWSLAHEGRAYLVRHGLLA